MQDAEMIYDDVTPGPSKAEDEGEKVTTIRLPTRVVKKKEQGCSTPAVAIALSIVFTIFSFGLLNYFLLSTNMCNVHEISAMQKQILDWSSQIIQNQALHAEYRKQIDSANERLKQLERVVNFFGLNISQFISPVNCSLARSQLTNLKELSNGKKYFFSDSSKVNWTSANKKCKGMGLHLATLTDKADLDTIHAEAIKTIKRQNEFWWLSAKNYGIGDRLNFHWHDGSELQESSTLWRDEADKLKGCVYFWSGNEKKLNGLNCNENRYFICELPKDCY
ncbi:uncharacterized protein LOC132197433 isoform X1 [Neocloeon triangulifer]|uniref:uncharacterized protein LOC132197433 isoform X1 n=1 Tax=Neocloeon triangulifer TaxID=2078957 RepID=UPI00286FA753|nr:uncharacterized protein LOC132197433 isoform X1 [Neocloeon triangulifer]